MKRWSLWGVSVLALLAVGGSADGASRIDQPRPLEGVPLQGQSGLHLVGAGLVGAGRRAFVLNVDSGSVADVKGVPEAKRGFLSVVPVGGHGAALVGSGAGDAAVYALSSAHSTASNLGVGKNVAPDETGKAVWIETRKRPGRCAIRRSTLSGRTTLRHSFPCAATIASGGRTGLVVNRTRLYDPRTGKIVLRTRWGVLAAAGSTLVLLGPRNTFVLLDPSTRRRHRLRWPSVVETRGGAVADPRGRFVALGFEDPSWHGSGRQVLDVWVLDARTRRLVHVPGMPAFVSLKRTSMAWTDDGRLVFLARSNGRDIVAVWRRGQRSLAIKSVRLGRGTRASDSFAPLG